MKINPKGSTVTYSTEELMVVQKLINDHYEIAKRKDNSDMALALRYIADELRISIITKSNPSCLAN